MKSFLVGLLFLISQAAFGATYYFSSGAGQDNYTSAQAQNQNTPWKSLTKLNAIFGTLKPGDSVLLKRGDVFVGSIVFNKSGTKANPIFVGAYGSGKKPVITGFTPISNWASIGNGKYEKTLSNAPTKSLNMVLVNKAVQPIGRYPKAGKQNASYLYLSDYTFTKLGVGITSHTLKSKDLAGVPSFVGGDLVQRTMQWIVDRAIVTNQSASSVTSTPHVSPGHPTVTYEPISGHGFFFQNHINTLSETGDWCYNQATKKITMFFGANNPANYNVEVSAVDTLISIHEQSFIDIAGIELKGANENLVNLHSTTNIAIRDCNLYNAGINAINVDKVYCSYTNNTTIEDCHINNSLNNAINAYESTYWTIRNNLIENTGTISGMGMSGDGQYIGLSSVGANSLIEYNEIANTGYSAIYYTGNNTILRFNHIHHFCLIKSDGGGIYTYGVTGKNRIVHRNIIHDGIGDRFGMGEQETPYSMQVHGIYNDTHSSGINITENSSFNNAHCGIWFGSNTDISASDNTFYNNKTTQVKGVDNEGLLANIVMDNNTLFAKEKGSLLMSFNVTGTSLGQIKSNNNQLCRPIWEPPNVNGTQGYSIIPFSWDSYHDGGTVEANHSFFSVENWRKLSKLDGNSQKSPVSINNPSEVIFEYNATKQSKTINLTGTYRDLKNNYYTSVTLEPYTSIILIQSEQLTTLQQNITFVAPGVKAFGDAPFALNATASSGLPVSLRVVSGAATLTGNTLTITGAGNIVVEATQGGNANFKPATPVTQTITVDKRYQAIAFTTPANRQPNDGVVTLNATATSSLQVHFKVLLGQASLNGTSLTINGAGNVVVEASQPGNNNYNAAASVTQTIVTGKANQSISFAPITGKILGSAPFTVTPTATSGLPVSLKVTAGSATIAGYLITPTGSGTVTIEASQNGDALYNAATAVSQSFSVTTIAQSPINTITGCSASGTILREQWNKVFGTAVSDIPLHKTPNSSSQITKLETENTGDWMGARIRGYICPPTSGNYIFTIAGDDGVELWLSTDHQEKNKLKIAGYVGWTGFQEWDKYPAQKSSAIYLQYGTKYFIEVLHKNGAGGDNVSVKWQMPNGVTEAPIPGSRLSPYTATTTSVTKVNQSINFAPINDCVLGIAPFTITTAASSGLPVSLRVISGAATLTNNMVSITGSGIVTIKASQAGNSTYNAAAVVIQSFKVAAPAVAIVAPATGCTASGSILREQWTNIFGTAVADIPVNKAPNSSSQITKLETENTGDWMGARIRGYICPPLSGNYNFTIAGDDGVELWLSTDDQMTNKVKIAGYVGWTGYQEWDKYPAQKSGAIYLKTGQKYFIEVLHKNGAGGDNVSVKWQMPNGVTEAPIPGSRLSPYTAGAVVSKLNQSITFGPIQAKILGNAPFTLVASASSGLPVQFQIVDGQATINGNIVTLSGTGNVTIEATQQGNANYNPAAAIRQSFTVHAVPAAPINTLSACSATGTILREEWKNVWGTAVSDIPLNKKASATYQLNKLETENTGDWMGSRISGYLCPPITGNYTFTIAGDDGVELWLSSDDIPAGKVKIAGYVGWTGYQEWDKYPGQKSASIYLQTGKKYYIEVLHKNGGGGDNMSVKWQLPNGVTEAPIPGSRLSPYVPGTEVASAKNKTAYAQVWPEEAKTVSTNSKVFPNPFQAFTNFKYVPYETGETNIIITDLQGRIIKTVFKGLLEHHQTRTFRITADGLRNGAYLIKVSSLNYTATHKMVMAK